MKPDGAAIGGPVNVALILETGGGGSGRHVLDLHRQLRLAGWNSRLVLSDLRFEDGFAAEVAQVPAGQVTLVNVRRSPHWSDAAAVARIRHEFAGLPGRLILHAHSTKAGMLAAAVTGVADGKVFTPHAYRGMDETLHWAAAKGVRAIETFLTRRFDRVIAVSPEEERYVRAMGVGGERVRYVPNGVDGGRLRQRVAEAARPQRASPEPVLGFVGRFVYQKNVELFLETMRVVRERGVAVRAVIVGDGALRPQLLQLAERHGLSALIDWRGHAPAVEELGKMDVFVHTSRYESFPYSLLEVAAAGVPTVSVKNAGSEAVFGALTPEAIVPEGTADALAAAIIRLLKDDALRQRNVAGLRAVSERFTLQNMVRETIEVYEEALACG